ncbi:molybdate ABC transporter substrate-binding protein [Alteromonas sp. KC3]|uniref:molybdate ABC transporter substrate-binding protein n=1 Tax=unclassified Alteromonas TaxID=2614992 RepID=UPI00192253E2|nr:MULTISPECIES: molybdate ABC transporter substrate-binding protein [unclassified Alteromonas]BCO19476.1 molybdate ABC transporter substrate-binding protein [Alteromonas sp. KC3]BCO23441.1 molybdate ABC transporter substrate-binding protein [Alteromonas sp. KC14]
MSRFLTAVIFLTTILAVLLLGKPALSAEERSVDTLNVAVAANFAKPLQFFANQFSQITGIETRITVSSSGTLYAQLQHGAQFDVFLSADRQRPIALAESGVVHTENVVNYAQGQLAFVYRTSDFTQVPDALSELVLSAMSMGKVAMANPKLAPYGDAAKDVLNALNLYNDMQTHRVIGKNVLQTYQFFTTNNVSGAFVAYSLTPVVMQEQDENIGTFLVPSSLHKPIVQSLAINSRVKAQLVPNRFNEQPFNKIDALMSVSASNLFVQYLLSDKVQAQLNEWGYLPAKKTDIVGPPEVELVQK